MSSYLWPYLWPGVVSLVPFFCLFYDFFFLLVFFSFLLLFFFFFFCILFSLLVSVVWVLLVHCCCVMYLSIRSAFSRPARVALHCLMSFCYQVHCCCVMYSSIRSAFSRPARVALHCLISFCYQVCIIVSDCHGLWRRACIFDKSSRTTWFCGYIHCSTGWCVGRTAVEPFWYHEIYNLIIAYTMTNSIAV